MTNQGPERKGSDDLPKFWIKPYYSSFNGLRGAAVFIVFLHHYSGFWAVSGFWGAEKLQAVSWVGVDLFFVLSGFLITGILYDSLNTDRYFQNFYIRRSLRIFPAFYGLFALLLLATIPLHLHYPWTLLTFGLYIGNWFVPFVNLNIHNPTVISIPRPGHFKEVINIGHFWSLCIEEQFYLIWPSVIFFMRDRKKLLRLCTILCLLTLVERFFIASYLSPSTHTMLMHWSTFTRFDTLLVGAWLALWLRGQTLSKAQLRKTAYFLFWIPFIALVAGLKHYCNSFQLNAIIGNQFLYTAGYSLIALSCAGILLLSLDETSSLSKMMRFKPLATLGTISYGFYLIHMLPESGLIMLSEHHPKLFPWVPEIAFMFTLVTAILSFRYFETPFLRLKRKLAPQEAPLSSKGTIEQARFHVEEPQTD
jgi:peptidoglycan/LPS O-acetylase OafA/YrhL